MPDNIRLAPRFAMGVVPVSIRDYWRMLDHAAAFETLMEAAEEAERLEAPGEAAEAFLLACERAFAPKSPQAGAFMKRLAETLAERCREDAARRRRGEFRVVV